ncbi:hypothetical protein F4861DRAFT_199543 [Xylaria intraflava]|nr:hypothetical protein F4861DRAFT_199543 [Xylaria intraflava]
MEENLLIKKRESFARTDGSGPRGNPNLMHESRFTESWEPSGGPDARLRRNPRGYDIATSNPSFSHSRLIIIIANLSLFLALGRVVPGKQRGEDEAVPLLTIIQSASKVILVVCPGHPYGPGSASHTKRLCFAIFW